MAELGIDSRLIMLLAPLILIQLVLLIIALIDCVRIKDTNGPKWMWFIIICAISIFGPVIYFLVGRRNH